VAWSDLYDKIRMNASDIVKAKQNRTLFQAYYHPAIVPSTTSTTTIYTSSLIRASQIDSNPPTYVSTVCSTMIYNNLCMPSFISYQLANDVNDGKYLCNTYTLAQQVGADTVLTTSTAVNLCTLSNLQWKSVNPTVVYEYSTLNSTLSTVSSFSVTSTFIQTGPMPVICPLISFYQGTNFDNRCSVCPQNGPCTC
jgi:hypothetical protein